MMYELGPSLYGNDGRVFPFEPSPEFSCRAMFRASGGLPHTTEALIAWSQEEMGLHRAVVML